MSAPPQPTNAHPTPTFLGEPEGSIIRSIAILRSLLVGWMTAVLVLARGHVGRWTVAIAAVAVAAIWSEWLRRTATARPTDKHKTAMGLGGWIVAARAELVIASMLLASDRFVWNTNPGQRLGSAWPLVSVLQYGVLKGRTAGMMAGAALGLANGVVTVGMADTFGSVRQAIGLDGKATQATIGIMSTGVLYGLAGFVAGAVTDRLRAAERAIVEAQVREDVARELHDGVLQTLAIVQRRSDDEQLARLAREQETELRRFLAGDATNEAVSLEAAIRAQAQLAEQRFGATVQVVTTSLDASIAVPRSVIEAVAGAVGEALTNAAKHGDASQMTVFVDDDGNEWFCSVKDDGVGFDAQGDSHGGGRGIAQSIRARIDSVGGTTQIVSAPGAGCEVIVRVPHEGARG